MIAAIVSAIVGLISALAPIIPKLVAGHITEAEARAMSTAAVAQFAAALDASAAGDAQRDKETDAALDAIDAAKHAGGVQAHGPAPIKIEGLELLGGGDKTGGSLT